MNRRLFLQTIAASSALLAGQNLQAAEFELIEGVQYKTLKSPVDTGGKKVVLEIFGYTCPHCYHLEPSIHEWLKTKPADVQFERMPVVFNNPNWITMARVFYTCQRLGILDQSHEAFFHAIHRDKMEFSSLEALGKFMSKFDRKKDEATFVKDFVAMFNSFVVDGDVKKAAKLTRQYEVEGVPAVIINGKFLTDVPMAKGTKEMWEVVDELTAK